MYYKPWIYLYILDAIVMITFLVGMANLVYFWTRGGGIGLKRKLGIWWIARAIVLNVLLQTQILKLGKLRWAMHMCIFYGFIGLLVFYWQTPLWTFLKVDFFVNGPGPAIVKAICDLSGLVLLAGICIAFVRRFIAKPEQLDTITSDAVTLIYLLLIALTGFLNEGVRYALYPQSPEAAGAFIGMPLGALLSGLGLTNAAGTAMWVIHITISFSFIAYFPFSKLAHAFAAPLNVLANASEEGDRKDLYGSLVGGHHG
jgi:heterodisulfide reductase subunit E